jgi:hypothetical protein
VNHSASTITALLRKRYPPREYAFFSELRNGTGYTNVVRTADVVVMSTWPSRGLDISGFEIKCDRRDWLREKAQPEKSEEIGRFCDYFWLVTSDEKVCQLDELPTTWGLMTVVKDKLKIVKQSKHIGSADRSISRTFVAAMLRRASDASTEDFTKALNDELHRIRNEEAARREDLTQKAVAVAVESRNRQHKELYDAVAAFEKASGIAIRNPWTAERMGDAVRILTSGHRTVSAVDVLRSHAETLNDVRLTIIAAIDALETPSAEPDPPPLDVVAPEVDA